MDADERTAKAIIAAAALQALTTGGGGNLRNDQAVTAEIDAVVKVTNRLYDALFPKGVPRVRRT